MTHGGLDMEAKDNTEKDDMVRMVKTKKVEAEVEDMVIIDKTIKVDESKENIQPRMMEEGHLTKNLEDIAERPPERLVDLILPDFSWPAGKEAPNSM